MSELIYQAAKAFGEKLDEKLGLKNPTTIIEAPPSDQVEYPACAIWIEHWHVEWQTDQTIGTNEDGDVMLGYDAAIEHPTGALMVADGVSVSLAGSLRCSGRIWTGSRYPAQRAQLAGKIVRLFADPVAPGTLLCTMTRPKIDEYTLPVDWTAAVFLDGEMEWSNEFAFSERLWQWLPFSLDVDLLVPRGGDDEQLMTQMMLLLTSDLDNTVAAPTDLEAPHHLRNLESHTVNSDGDPT